MAVLTVNGTALPTPESVKYTLQDLSSEDGSGRTLDGTMYKDRVAQKRTLECAWALLSPSDAQTVLSTINNTIMMQVQYFDPVSRQVETRTFYVGDRSVEFLTLKTGKEYCRSISCNFIEQ